MKKIKLLYAITGFEVGGAKYVVTQLIKNIDRNIFDIYLLTNYSNNSNNHIGQLDIKIKKLPFLVRNINPLLDLIALISIYTYLRKEKFDIIHTHTSKAGFLVRVAARLLKTKVIVHTPHGHLYQSDSKIQGVAKLKTFFKIIETWINKFTDKIVCISKDELEVYVALRIAKRDKLELIYNGLDTNNYKIQPRGEDGLINIGTISRLVPEKGLEYFIDMVELLAGSTYKFRIVGYGNQEKFLKQYAKAKRIFDKIEFIIPSNGAIDQLKDLDIFVSTSLYEGLGISIMEAMAAGKPVIATKTGGVPELIRDGVDGLLAPTHDAQALKEHVELLVKDRDLALEMASSARKRVEEQFSLDKMVSRTQALYLELLN